MYHQSVLGRHGRDRSSGRSGRATAERSVAAQTSASTSPHAFEQRCRCGPKELRPPGDPEGAPGGRSSCPWSGSRGVSTTRGGADEQQERAQGIRLQAARLYQAPASPSREGTLRWHPSPSKSPWCRRCDCPAARDWDRFHYAAGRRLDRRTDGPRHCSTSREDSTRRRKTHADRPPAPRVSDPPG